MCVVSTHFFNQLNNIYINKLSRQNSPLIFVRLYCISRDRDKCSSVFEKNGWLTYLLKNLQVRNDICLRISHQNIYSPNSLKGQNTRFIFFTPIYINKTIPFSAELNESGRWVAKIVKTLADNNIINIKILNVIVNSFLKNILIVEVYRTNIKINQWDHMIGFVLQFEHQSTVSVNQVHNE